MIIFTQGDDNFNMTMTATDADGNAVDLTGATFETRLLGTQGRVVSVPNAQHTADADQVTNKGKYTINLLAANTNACAPGDTKDIVTKVTIGTTTISYHGKGILQVLPKDPQA